MGKLHYSDDVNALEVTCGLIALVTGLTILCVFTSLPFKVYDFVVPIALTIAAGLGVFGTMVLCAWIGLFRSKAILFTSGVALGAVFITLGLCIAASTYAPTALAVWCTLGICLIANEIGRVLGY